MKLTLASKAPIGAKIVLEYNYEKPEAITVSAPHRYTLTTYEDILHLRSKRHLPAWENLAGRTRHLAGTPGFFYFSSPFTRGRE